MSAMYALYPDPNSALRAVDGLRAAGLDDRAITIISAEPMEQVAKVLTDRGFTKEQVDQRLAQLSPQDLHQLAQNIDQVQAAGLTRQEWIWIGIGALAALILVIALG